MNVSVPLKRPSVLTHVVPVFPSIPGAAHRLTIGSHEDPDDLLELLTELGTDDLELETLLSLLLLDDRLLSLDDRLLKELGELIELLLLDRLLDEETLEDCLELLLDLLEDLELFDEDRLESLLPELNLSHARSHQGNASPGLRTVMSDPVPRTFSHPEDGGNDSHPRWYQCAFPQVADQLLNTQTGPASMSMVQNMYQVSSPMFWKKRGRSFEVS